MDVFKLIAEVGAPIAGALVMLWFLFIIMKQKIEDTVNKVKMSLSGKDNCRVILHKNSGHGFNCWNRDSWNQSAAATARGQSLVHLMETLG